MCEWCIHARLTWNIVLENRLVNHLSYFDRVTQRGREIRGLNEIAGTP